MPRLYPLETPGNKVPEESLEQIFEKHGNNIAAVIVEPIMGNMGVILPEPCFLEFLRDITEA